MIPLSSPPPRTTTWRSALAERPGEGSLRDDPALPFIGFYLEIAEQLLSRADERPYWPPGLKQRS